MHELVDMSISKSARHFLPMMLMPVGAVVCIGWAYARNDGGIEPTSFDPPPPTMIMVNSSAAKLTALSATVQLSAQVMDQYGQLMAGVAVTWQSDDAFVAPVDAPVSVSS